MAVVTRYRSFGRFAVAACITALVTATGSNSKVSGGGLMADKRGMAISLYQDSQAVPLQLIHCLNCI